MPFLGVPSRVEPWAQERGLVLHLFLLSVLSLLLWLLWLLLLLFYLQQVRMEQSCGPMVPDFVVEASLVLICDLQVPASCQQVSLLQQQPTEILWMWLSSALFGCWMSFCFHC